MGDPRRNVVFAEFIAATWPDIRLRIADVAGGKGELAAELYRRGFRSVVTFDKRRNRANPARSHYRYAFFEPEMADDFDLLVAMHPDEATDVVMAAAIERRLPYAVVPCCARPQAWPFDEGLDPDIRQRLWFVHLIHRAKDKGSAVEMRALPMSGANVVLFDRVLREPDEAERDEAWRDFKYQRAVERARAGAS